MTMQRRAVAVYGERFAARYLQDKGLVLLDRNWRCPDGEVDLILRDGDDIVFCEVKTRRDGRYGSPAEAVDQRKVRKLRLLAGCWLAESGIRPRAIRFDVVAVLARPRGATQVEHIPSAF